MGRKSVKWAVILLAAAAYLMNPGAGIFEFIPDNIPLIGNVDESLAVLIALRALIELGIIKKESAVRLLNLKGNYGEKILGKKQETDEHA